MFGMEAFTVVYLMLFLVLPIVLIGSFFGLIAWTLRSGRDPAEEDLSTPLALEDEG
jgi:hypothetical protein